MPDLSQRLQDALSDRYRVVGSLGRGGMATVFLAEDLKHGRRVAIKVLDPEVAAAIGHERFLREIATVAGLTHPHIVPLHDSGQAGGLVFFVMPYVEGETLRDRLKREKQLPLEEALRVALETADALRYAHAHGLVHRDIKPENILLESGHAVVADFGVVRAVAAGGTGLTGTGIAVGTPAYMSPEQAAGTRELDGRSDLYSLGCVLYEMLAGVPPFAGSTAESLAHQHLSVDPRPVTELRPTVPAKVAAVLQRLLAKAPADRYASAEALAAALADAAAHPGATAVTDRRRTPALAVAGTALALVLVLGGYAAWMRAHRTSGAIESLAVMPLDNLSRDPSQDYFVDGMTEELINQVAQTGGVRVISRMSVMTLKGTRLALPEVGRKLGVQAVVVGSVQRVGDEVKVTAELIRTKPEREVWARSYERRIDDVLALQGEIAGAIAQELRIKLAPERRARMAAARPVKPEAHEAYLKGRFFMNKQEEKGIRTALEYFQRSVRIDSLYAPGWAGVGDAYYNLSNVWLEPRVAIPQARAAVERALRLDPDLPEAHATLGILNAAYDWDWTGAERECRRALELNPSLSQCHFNYGYLLTALGRFDEAIAECSEAERLDPLSTYMRVLGAWPYYLAGRYDEAIAAWREAEQVEPGYAPTHLNLGQAYEQKGMFPEAIRELETGTKLADNPSPLAFLCHAYASAGRRDDALATLARMHQAMKEHHVTADAMAVAYAGLGDKDRAFQWLEQAYQNRDEDLVYLKTDPKLASLRSDPRFRELLRRMHLAS